MQEKYEVIKLRLSEKSYMPTFHDEYYEYLAKKFRTTVKELKSGFSKQKDYYKSLTIPMGKSRIGGSVVDLPPNIEYPHDTCLVAQLNCEEISKYDKLKLLPTKGFIYVFIKNMDIEGVSGIVIYSDADVSQLERVIKNESFWFGTGQLIEGCENLTESFEQRFINEDGEFELGCNTVEDMTRVYGMYTYGVYEGLWLDSEPEVREIVENKNNMILLLEIANDCPEVDGSYSVYINENDLLNRDFSKCIFVHSQS
ncbi:DUF1963 domain-containing protein [Moraxellaceae bacterium AER2_44_116]|nr:DUF1963 domain-containing protein [Moraxellaceae bacterium]TQC96546.1 DUF1963 domain-containing protein [Moraxellaceae bacterium AER2_44_116]